jgi:CRISPR-associated endoribonuclease Cas6
LSLLAAVLHVQADRALPSWLGRAAQAWLLEQIRRTDPVLAGSLHGGQTRRPYTISGPRGQGTGRWLRITSLSADLAAVLSDTILPTLRGQSLKLAGVEIGIRAVETATHAWAGCSDYETLARLAFESESLPAPGFEFDTPTTFHHDGLAVPVPLPSLVYGSLIRAWDSFSPLPLPTSLLPFVERCVGIARHRIATRMVQFGGSERHVGFIGTACYVVVPQPSSGLSPGEYRQRVQLLDLLTRFAFYSGVGARTAVGMGQVRPLSQLDQRSEDGEKPQS